MGFSNGKFSRRGVIGAAAGIVVLEAALFSPSLSKFFCGDSLYYLSRRVTGLNHLLSLFTSLDALKSYRPLTYVVFTYLLYPLFSLSPLGYHAFFLVAHLVVSLLVFELLRRMVAEPAAALAGMFFFGVHAMHFYTTYDASFLPDFGMGLLGVGSLVAYAHSVRENSSRWRAASVALFVLALLFKESAVMLPAGLAVVDLMVRRRENRPAPLGRSLLPHLVVAAAYLLFQLYLRGGELYPTDPGPYRLSISLDTLFLKLKYLPWLFGLPASPEKVGWWTAPPALLLLPALGWVGARLLAGWRSGSRIRHGVLLFGAWSLAALLPVLFLTQVPMKHNLYFSVLALAAALAVCVDGEIKAEGRLPRHALLFLLSMAASVAFQVRNDLRYSWVGEGSDITERSLRAVQRTHPTLPRGAMLYLLPAGFRGNISWYFDGGALFRLFYHDPALQMRFADLGGSLPHAFRQDPAVLIFRFREGDRLYEVTREYKLEAGDRDSDRLLARFSQAQVSTSFVWKRSELPQGRQVASAQQVCGETLRAALVMMPGTTARFPLPPRPAGSVLLWGAVLAGKAPNGTTGRVAFESTGGNEELLRLTLDPGLAGDRCWDGEVDLGRLQGRTGTLIVENQGGQPAGWIAWSRLRIVPRSSLFYMREESGSRPMAERGLRLLDQLDSAELDFDRSEVYPDYAKFDTPTGRPVFLLEKSPARPPHLSMLTIAGARAKFALPALPQDAVLEVSASHALAMGDGVRGQIYWEQAGRRELLFDQLLFPRQTEWLDRDISLARWAGQSGVLSFEASSGPAHNTVADWFAWGRLRIVSKPQGQ